MATATIYTVANRFKRDLLLRERAAASELVHYYGEIWSALNDRIQTLARQYYQAAGDGEDISQHWLLEFEQLQDLRTQVEEQINAFARFAESKIISEQQEAVWSALSHTEYLMGWVADKAGKDLIWSRLPVQALSNLVGTLSDGSPLQSLLGEYGSHAAQTVADGLVVGLAMGQSPRVIARAIRAVLGNDLNRALRISRTEVMRSYREASRASYLANPQVVSGYIRRSARSARTCAACWAKDGQIYSLNTPLDDHPNGRCFMVGFDPEMAEYYHLEDTGLLAFERLSNTEKLEILGPAKFAAYQDGAIGLNDLVATSNDPLWGSTVHEASLINVLGADEAKKYNMLANMGIAGNAGDYSAEDLIKVAGVGLRDLSTDEIQKIVTYVSRADFEAEGAQRVGGRVAGQIWEGNVLRGSDRLPPGVVHYLKHVGVKEEWPVGTSLEEYYQSLQEIIEDPESQILVSKISGYWQVGFLGKSGDWRGPAGDDYIWVEYRLGYGYWVTGLQMSLDSDIFKVRRELMQWLTKQE